MINHDVNWIRDGRSIVLDVADAPVTEKRRSNIKISPRQMRLEYSRNDGADWSDGYATVTGARIKGDGTPGRSDSDVHFYSIAGDMPEWLRELVEYHRPSGSV